MDFLLLIFHVGFSGNNIAAGCYLTWMQSIMPRPSRQRDHLDCVEAPQEAEQGLHSDHSTSTWPEPSSSLTPSSTSSSPLPSPLPEVRDFQFFYCHDESCLCVSEKLEHIFILKLWQVQKVVKQNYNFKNSKLHRRQTAPGWIFSLSLTSLLLWLEVWVDVGIGALLTHVCGVVGDGELVNLHLPIST